MTLPTHRLRVPLRVVEFFGSELDLVAAINRLAEREEEQVEVEVPHDTWERFRDDRGSMNLVRLRSAIMLAALEQLSPPKENRPPGTLMIAQKVTDCPYCEKPVYPDTVMVNTYGPRGGTYAVHWQCANRAKISYRVTGKLIEGIAWSRKQVVKSWLDRARARFQ